MAPASPALAGRFFTSEPPGKPCGITVEPHNCTLVHLFQRIENHYGEAAVPSRGGDEEAAAAAGMHQLAPLLPSGGTGRRGREAPDGEPATSAGE